MHVTFRKNNELTSFQRDAAAPAPVSDAEHRRGVAVDPFRAVDTVGDALRRARGRDMRDGV